MINFCYDRLSSDRIGYPNLATWKADPYTAEWRQFDNHWPRTIPLRLLMYLDLANIPYCVSTVVDAPAGSYYPVGISWFDFSIDYIANLSIETTKRVREGEIKLLFYYHEGDNPGRIKLYLDQLCQRRDIKTDSYVLISANSAAEQLENCIYFPDHEYFFRFVNRDQTIPAIPAERNYDFTLLNRTHKWWRASCTCDLLHHGVLSNSLWSYNTQCDIGDDPLDNPIELDSEPGWRQRVDSFYNNGPYTCDEFTATQQNDHHCVNTELYHSSYFHIVTETHFDADQSSGTFITEKTFKPIKFGQPFVVVGPQGTLAALRNTGYRVFDQVLDNSYDTIKNNTERWTAVRKLLIGMQLKGTGNLFKQCMPDIEWNQKMFLSRAVDPLNTLIEKLTCQI